MNKRKLLKLAALLDVVPDENFNMLHYAVSDEPMRNRPICASVACALGWATAIPEFAKAGLELRACRGDCYAGVHYGTYSEEEAAMKFFGLTVEETMALFYSSFRATAKQKAADIRELVQQRRTK